MECLKVLELYSGIGGMHFGLKLSELDAKIVAAVDINPNANKVYRYNFKEANVLQKTIEGIKLEEYDKLAFDMILMSPPCQPFTRQGNQNGSNDNRAQSFLHLTKILKELRKKPKYILMENVKGFDKDLARDQFVETLKELNYSYQEFLLSPIQFGIPNSRLRYFLIAKLDSPFSFKTTSEIKTNLPDEVSDWIENIAKCLQFDKASIQNELNNSKDSKETGEDELDDMTCKVNDYQINESFQACCQSESTNLLAKSVRKLDEFVLNEIGNNSDFHLSKEIFAKSIPVMDVVSTNSTRTNCFTKNYGRYLDGTGSILNVNPSQSDSNEKTKLNRSSLRFFTPKEIANLHCFPNDFEFPSDLSQIQKWRLIGNSLNVFLVAILIKLMTK